MEYYKIHVALFWWSVSFLIQCTNTYVYTCYHAKHNVTQTTRKAPYYNIPYICLQAARECTDEELMEIVLPRLAKVITLWEFLVMKVEKGNPAWPHADDIYREYERLHEHVKKLCQEYLQYLPEPQTEKHPSLFKVLETNLFVLWFFVRYIYIKVRVR